MRIRSRIACAAVLVFVAFLSGCGGGGGDRGTSASPQAAATSSSARIAGKIVDENGNPVAGAQVLNGDNSQTVTTDGNGYFSLLTSAFGASGIPVRLTVSKPGYFDGLHVVRVAPDTVINGTQSATLRILKRPSTAAEATQAQIVKADGSTVNVAPTAVSQGGETVYQTTVNVAADDKAVSFIAPSPVPGASKPSVTLQIGSADGANASSVLGAAGAVTGSISYGDPTDAKALETFPGEFITSSNLGGGSGEGALITAGFARINLTDANGRPITSFAPGTSVKITMTIPAGTLNPETHSLIRANDTIPVFVYNESTGEWVVERNADNSVKRATVQQDNAGILFVEFTTTHLSIYNLDFKEDYCSEWGVVNGDTPIAHIVDGDGKPVTGATVYVETPSGWMSGSRTIDDSTLEIWRAPRGIPVTVRAEKDGVVSETKTVFACKEKDSGDNDFNLIIEPRKPKCSSDADCNDGNPLTSDTCRNPGKQSAVCINIPCNIACAGDSQCDDGKSSTLDACMSPNTCQSFCSHQTCTPACTADAGCDDGNQLTADVCISPGKCEASCKHTACTPACTADSMCNDGNPLTSDTCLDAGKCTASCKNTACTPACTSDTSCRDDSALTIDACINPNTCAAACTHTQCTPVCSTNDQCNDQNANTTDTCTNPGTCQAACTHVVKPACYKDADCSDNNANTVDSCLNPGTSNAVCRHGAATCELSLDKENYAPGDTMIITFTASNQGAAPVNCGAGARLKRQQSPQMWDSFDENLYITIPPGQSITRVLTKVVPADWTGTDSPAGSDYDMYTIHQDGTEWGSGDNFNVKNRGTCTPLCSRDADCPLIPGSANHQFCINPGSCAAACSNTLCTVACSNDTQCSDSNPLTNDVCTGAGTCSAACSHTQCSPLCISDLACADTNPLTLDSCLNPNTCGASCAHTTCTPACVSDIGCNDSNALTIDACLLPNTCTASCTHTACTPACTSDAGCNDSNLLTIDACLLPNTCGASCSHTACTPACTSDLSCSDGNALTIDACLNPNTCNSSCTHTACTPACTNDAGCNDSNALTIDTCNSPNTCTASCSHTPCNVTCSNDAQCNDNNALTIDACNNPGTCGASCSNTSFTPVCSTDANCNDGNPATTDACLNPNTINASCSHLAITASASPNSLTLAGGPANSTLSCVATGTVTLVEGRCSSTDNWQAIATGTTKLCTYNTKGTFTPGCRVNSTVTADAAPPVVVSNIPPSASAQANPTSGPPPLAVNFSGTCTDIDGTCVSYLWNFGDGSPTSSLQNPSHNYTVVGGYQATLSVTDDSGAAATVTLFVTVTNSSQVGKLFSGSGDMQAMSIQQTADGGYIVGGYMRGQMLESDATALAIKLDSQGNQVWTKYFTGDGSSVFNSIRQATDGGYIAVGNTSTSWTSPGDIWVMKLDASGNKVWEVPFVTSDPDYGDSVQQTSDGGYVALGYTYATIGGLDASYLRVYKLSASGAFVWTQSYCGTTTSCMADSIQQTSDQGYIVSGSMSSPLGTPSQAYVLRLDASGNKLWDSAFGGQNYAAAHSVYQIAGGGFIAAGSGFTTSNGEDILLDKFGTTGSTAWEKTFGGTDADRALSVWPAADGGYAMAGSTRSLGAGGWDIWVLKVDSSGIQQWNKTFGGASSDMGAAIQQTSDGGYVVAGSTMSFGPGIMDIWVIKLDASGNVMW